MRKSILFIQHPSDTLTYCPYADSIGNKSVIEWFYEWLRSAHPSLDAIIVTNSRHIAEDLQRITDRIGALVVCVPRRSKLHALQHLAKLYRSADYLELLPIGLPLAPADLLRSVNQHHLAVNNHCTLVFDLPPLFSPQIYTSEGLDILAQIPTSSMSLDPTALAPGTVLPYSRPEKRRFCVQVHSLRQSNSRCRKPIFHYVPASKVLKTFRYSDKLSSRVRGQRTGSGCANLSGLLLDRHSNLLAHFI